MHVLVPEVGEQVNRAVVAEVFDGIPGTGVEGVEEEASPHGAPAPVSG